MADRTCSVEGCDNGGEIIRGWCSKHYTRWRKYGDVDVIGPRSPAPAIDRFWRFVSVDEGGCWLWTGGRGDNGYGLFHGDKGRRIGAHRFSYEYHVGPIPEGYHVDHLCRVRHCVNPEHLEAVTPAENNRRSLSLSADNARKTHCIRGHPFDEVNTYRPPGQPSKRCCRECFRIRDRESRMGS